MDKLTQKETTNYTHRLEVKVMMSDLSCRVIGLDLNGWDEWEESGASPLETCCLFYRFLIRGLDTDNTVLGWQGSVYRIETGKQVTAFDPWIKEQYRVSA